MFNQAVKGGSLPLGRGKTSGFVRVTITSLELKSNFAVYSAFTSIPPPHRHFSLPQIRRGTSLYPGTNIFFSSSSSYNLWVFSFGFFLFLYFTALFSWWTWLGLNPRLSRKSATSTATCAGSFDEILCLSLFLSLPIHLVSLEASAAAAENRLS